MHSQNICHRDIKLDNIIKGKKSVIKLIDFGFAIELKG
jgi:serine/threonine protein kinase